jgi:hypothetical protein
LEDTLTEFEKKILAKALLSVDAGDHLTLEELKANAQGAPWSEDGDLTPAQQHLSRCRRCRALVLEMCSDTSTSRVFAPVPDISGVSGKAAASIKPDYPRDSTKAPSVTPQGGTASAGPRVAFSAPPALHLSAPAQPVSPAKAAPMAGSISPVQQNQAPNALPGVKSLNRRWDLRIAAAAAALLAVWVYGTHRPGSAGVKTGGPGVQIIPHAGSGGASLANEGGSADLALEAAVVETNGDVRLKWKLEPGANSYLYTVREGDRTGAIVSTQDTVFPSGFVTHSLLKTGKSYYWSVTAKSADGKVLASGSGMFTAR